MADEDLPVISESQWSANFGGGGDDLPTINESDFLKMAAPLIPSGGQSPEAQALIGANASPVQKFGRAIAGGLSQFIPFGDELVAGGASAIDDVKGFFQGEKFDPGTSYDNRLKEIRGYQQAMDIALRPSTTASVFEKVGPALLLPGPGKLKALVNNPISKIGASAVEGYGLGAVTGFAGGEGTEDRLEKGKRGGALGGLFGAGLESLGQAFFAAGDKLDDASLALNRKSVGATQASYSKTNNMLQRVETPEGDIESLTKNSLDDLLSNNKLGRSRDPSTLIKTAEEKMSSLGDDVKDLLKSADESRTAPAIPSWDKTFKYLQSSKMPADEVDKYLGELSDYQAALTKEGDGSLAYLQSQKQSLANKWNPANKVANNFWRAVYSDMQGTIEAAAPSVKGINKEIQKYILAKPMLERSLAAAENKEPVTGLMQGIRTSGGGGVPLLAGVYSGHPVAGAAGALGMWLSRTPQGLSQLSNMTGISADALSGLAAILSKSAPVAGAAIANKQEKPMDALPPSVFSPPGIEEKASVFSTDKKDIVLKTLAKAENSKGLTSPKGAQGTYQLMPEIRKKFGVKDAFNDKEAGEAAWKLYNEELERFKDPRLAFAAYNLGSPRLKEAIERAGSKDWKDVAKHVPKETRDYVARAEKFLSSAEG